MKHRNSGPFRITVALVAFLLCPFAVGEVGVVVGQDLNTVRSGPFVVSIIDNADPIGPSAWIRHSTVTGNRILLNENGFTNGDGRPSTARNTVSGLPIVTWGKNNGSGFDIVESHFESGAWTTPVIIVTNVMTSTDPEPFTLVDRNSGDVHVVYFAGEAAPSVMHVQAPANLSSWTTPTLVSLPAEYALRPSAATHEGTLRVAYESHGSSVGSTPRQIVVASSDGIGGFDHEALTSTHFGDPNRPRLHTGTGNQLWIDWVDDDNDMAWSVWRSATGWDSVSVEAFTDDEDRCYHARGRVKRLATQ